MPLTLEHIQTLIKEHDDYPNHDVEKICYDDPLTPGAYHYELSLIDSGLNTVIKITLDDERLNALGLKAHREFHQSIQTYTIIEDVEQALNDPSTALEYEIDNRDLNETWLRIVGRNERVDIDPMDMIRNAMENSCVPEQTIKGILDLIATEVDKAMDTE